MEQLSALLLTLLVELPLAVLLARRWQAPAARVALCAVAASLCTHAPAWYLIREALPPLLPGFWSRALPVEGVLTVAEGLLYAWLVPLSLRRGLGMSVLANGASFAVGLLPLVQRVLAGQLS